MAPNKVMVMGKEEWEKEEMGEEEWEKKKDGLLCKYVILKFIM